MGEFVDVGLYVGVMVAPDVIFLVASSMCLESSVQGLSRLLGLFFFVVLFFLRILSWPSYSFTCEKIFTIRKISGPPNLRIRPICIGPWKSLLVK